MRLHRNVQAGVEYNPAAGDVAPLATVFLLTETERRPAAFLGTSSDRIGSPAGTQSYYLTVAKFAPLVRTGFYASLSWSEWDERFNFPFGAQVEFGRGVYVRPMYDGERSHGLAGAAFGRFNAAFVWAWFEKIGASLAIGF